MFQVHWLSDWIDVIFNAWTGDRERVRPSSNRCLRSLLVRWPDSLRTIKMWKSDWHFPESHRARTEEKRTNWKRTNNTHLVYWNDPKIIYGLIRWQLKRRSDRSPDFMAVSLRLKCGKRAGIDWRIRVITFNTIVTFIFNTFKRVFNPSSFPSIEDTRVRVCPPVWMCESVRQKWKKAKCHSADIYLMR